ncbi:DUF2726 domain-containing protein [Vibrio sp. LaRot3]|uniref:DUF2726 domain-containing protein n=1 Tax=Vibrio sp. LaRot3 TaxID=2998829 RepID=UPI0022CDBD0A|nr:DUF2726 domain-containing protein [Vibrio sp. LaRot3]MDA0147349.1 DUF2726 domain-containing protein [Vibrio sp. LaRot3]
MLKVIFLIALGYLVWKLIQSKKAPKQSWRDNAKVISSSKQPTTSNKQLISNHLESTKPLSNYVEHTKQSHLATENEKKMYFALQKALPPEYVIHCQVSLMALVKPTDFKNNSRTWAKRMDYVITDKATRILAVIELDDSSHNKKKRQERDEYVNNALHGHHPLIRFQTQRFYEPSEIALKLEQHSEIRCNSLEEHLA